MKSSLKLNIFSYCFCGFIAILCLIPFLMVFSASFTAEEVISLQGFGLFPKRVFSGCIQGCL